MYIISTNLCPKIELNQAHKKSRFCVLQKIYKWSQKNVLNPNSIHIAITAQNLIPNLCAAHSKGISNAWETIAHPMSTCYLNIEPL